MTETWGWVKMYNPARRYGFIAGDDGYDYFFHVSDILGDSYVWQGCQVKYLRGMADKGPRAFKVVVVRNASQRAGSDYRDPSNFIMTRGSAVRGYDIHWVIARDCWYEAWDPNEAREGLRRQAITMGANAIVGLRLSKYSKSPYHWFFRNIRWVPNYYQTMHRFCGTAVVVKGRA